MYKSYLLRAKLGKAHRINTVSAAIYVKGSARPDQNATRRLPMRQESIDQNAAARIKFNSFGLLFESRENRARFNDGIDG
jgi:hypothetical protein